MEIGFPFKSVSEHNLIDRRCFFLYTRENFRKHLCVMNDNFFIVMFKFDFIYGIEQPHTVGGVY